MPIDRCPVCQGLDTRLFLQREHVPVHQNLVLAQQAQARAITRGSLQMHVCCSCGFVFNAAFDTDRLSYGQDYDNTQAHSAAFDAYLDGLAAQLVGEHGVRNARIVEVGCGKGHFLHKLVNFPEAGNSGFGFDPSYVGPEVVLDGRLRFRRSLYDASCADVPADVVVCRHVIEHVADPLPLLRAVRAALSRSPRARVFFETPCVEWILRNQVVWDWFYEHCSLFGAPSLCAAFERSGFVVDAVSHVFGGQYLWLCARPADVAATPCVVDPGAVVQLALAYGRVESSLRADWLQRLTCLREQGPVALWGAGAKGVTFANLTDPQATLLDCVVDINPNKQGRFVPGSAHAIVAPQALPARGVRSVVLMNPNYRREVRQTLAGLGNAARLITWSDTCDSR